MRTWVNVIILGNVHADDNRRTVKTRCYDAKDT